MLSPRRCGSRRLTARWRAPTPSSRPRRRLGARTRNHRDRAAWDTPSSVCRVSATRRRSRSRRGTPTRPCRTESGLGEKDIRAFGFFFDVQDSESRYMPGVRYVVSLGGTLVKRWQYYKVAEGVTPEDWNFGVRDGWCVPGVDNQWFGRRFEDGSADGYQWVPGGDQDLLYNESPDKINWLYLRLTVDVQRREYIEPLVEWTRSSICEESHRRSLPATRRSTTSSTPSSSWRRTPTGPCISSSTPSSIRRSDLTDRESRNVHVRHRTLEGHAGPRRATTSWSAEVGPPASSQRSRRRATEPGRCSSSDTAS